MSENREEIETLRLIRAFSKVRDPQRRKLIIEFTETAVPEVGTVAEGNPSDLKPGGERLR
ncbi:MULTISPECIES: hypothetical protein [unclassified Bradyrhizobium]|uniref:hypothetical protein n=1 Tax=unclassified Bradyrhizobium TaxID=2631580 RepID=UPI000429FD47|nr:MULTISPECIES: hypothetical protein [unclassified Bradyrhizobium]QIG95973.1 hypothetical protein G6P99_28650 [Bradyrhizobium sp. 6(2017)]